MRLDVKLPLRRHARCHEPQGNPGQEHDESDSIEQVRYKLLNHLVGFHHYTIAAAGHCISVFGCHATMVAR